MDLSSQIKNSLIDRIKNSNDLDFLKALQTIFDSSDQGLYELSEEQKVAIAEGKEQIKRGEFEKNDKVISEMREWLKTKRSDLTEGNAKAMLFKKQMPSDLFENEI